MKHHRGRSDRCALGARKVSRKRCLGHPCRVELPSGRGRRVGLFALCLLGAVSAGCVDDVRVLGDERARLACEQAASIAAPPVGCNVVQLESREPWGCAIDQGFGVVETRAGSWVRITRASDRPATLRLTLRSLAAAECDGGLPSPCELIVHAGPTPCSCEAGRYASYVVPAVGVPIEIELFDLETDVLLQPFGALFEVAVCDASMP